MISLYHSPHPSSPQSTVSSHQFVMRIISGSSCCIIQGSSLIIGHHTSLHSKQTNPVIGLSFALQGLQVETRAAVLGLHINNNQCPYINSVPKVSILVTLTLAGDRFWWWWCPLCYVMGDWRAVAQVLVKTLSCLG